MTTFVLVPGAWLGGWVWSRASALLEKEGHRVHPITLTGTGERVHLASGNVSLETAIEDVLNTIRYNDLYDFVLVGHSFAGKVAAAVADRVSERTRRVLYLDGFHPDKGVRTPQGAFPDEFPVTGSVVPLALEFLAAVGKDVQGANREWMISNATPTPVRYLRDPITTSEKLDTVKTAYIYCSGGDTLAWYLSQSLGKSADDVLRANLDGPYRVVDSGHWPMITNPEELVKDILSLSTK